MKIIPICQHTQNVNTLYARTPHILAMGSCNLATVWKGLIITIWKVKISTNSKDLSLSLSHSVSPSLPASLVHQLYVIKIKRDNFTSLKDFSVSVFPRSRTPCALPTIPKKSSLKCLNHVLGLCCQSLLFFPLCLYPEGCFWFSQNTLSYFFFVDLSDILQKSSCICDLLYSRRARTWGDKL